MIFCAFRHDVQEAFFDRGTADLTPDAMADPPFGVQRQVASTWKYYPNRVFAVERRGRY
jgi:hypothetical protein